MTEGDTENRDRGVLYQSDLKAILTQYTEVRAELRSVQKRFHRTTIIGVGVVGTVIGYALSADTHLLLLTVPILIGYFYTLGTQFWMEITFLGKKSRDIEERVDVPEFSWEEDYGGAWNDSKKDIPEFKGVKIDQVPILVLFIIGLCLYAAFSIVSISIINYNFDTIYVTFVAALFYVLFGVILGVVKKSYSKVHEHVNKKAKEDT